MPARFNVRCQIATVMFARAHTSSRKSPGGSLNYQSQLHSTEAMPVPPDPAPSKVSSTRETRDQGGERAPRFAAIAAVADTP